MIKSSHIGKAVVVCLDPEKKNISSAPRARGAEEMRGDAAPPGRTMGNMKSGQGSGERLPAGAIYQGCGK